MAVSFDHHDRTRLVSTISVLRYYLLTGNTTMRTIVTYQCPGSGSVGSVVFGSPGSGFFHLQEKNEEKP
jgi:hypothetical protein